MGLPLSWGVYKNRNEMEGLEAYKNKGKGNPYHDKLGKFTTGPSSSKGATAKAGKKKAEKEGSKAYFDEYSVGMTPLSAEKDEDGNWKVDSMATESDTHDIMEAYGRAGKVAELPYNKVFEGSDTYTKQAGMQLTQAARVLQQHTKKMGDHISGLSTDFGEESHDKALDTVAKLRTGASLAMVQIRDKDSKSYKVLRKAQDEIREASNLLASMQPYYLRQHEKQPVDVSDLFKK